MQARITKCYLIEITDDDGKEIESDFSFLSYHETKKQAQEMMERCEKWGATRPGALQSQRQKM